jgi:septal ring factor EnvC (AmiA/AmiB activator)
VAPETSTDQQELEKLRAEVARLERQIVSQREEFDRELVRRAFEIGRLEDEQGRGAEFERTLSWRVTAPLRGAGGVLRGRLRR